MKQSRDGTHNDPGGAHHFERESPPSMPTPPCLRDTTKINNMTGASPSPRRSPIPRCTGLATTPYLSCLCSDLDRRHEQLTTCRHDTQHRHTRPPRPPGPRPTPIHSLCDRVRVHRRLQPSSQRHGPTRDRTQRSCRRSRTRISELGPETEPQATAHAAHRPRLSDDGQCTSRPVETAAALVHLETTGPLPFRAPARSVFPGSPCAAYTSAARGPARPREEQHRMATVPAWPECPLRARHWESEPGRQVEQTPSPDTSIPSSKVAQASAARATAVQPTRPTLTATPAAADTVHAAAASGRAGVSADHSGCTAFAHSPAQWTAQPTATGLCGAPHLAQPPAASAETAAALCACDAAPAGSVRV